MHVAWAALERRADQLFDGRASWNLAAWLFAHGDVEAAQGRVSQSIAHSPDGASRRALVGLGKCYSVLGEYGALHSLLSDPQNAQRLGATLPYLQANAWRGDDAKRLASINEIFYRAGLADVVRKCDSTPLALDNLSSGEQYTAEGRAALAEHPLVSVVIPVFNAGETLQIALDGLLEQSLRSLEVIVVDDGSTDNTADVARDYAERDPRVRYMLNDVNMGAYPTRNNGMKAARGRFVTVHDSDDWSHPQKLERQLQPLLKDESKVASFSSWVRVLDDLTFVGPWLLNETFIEKNHSSALVRRSALDVIGLWDSVNVAADTEFLWRLEHHYGHQAIVHVLPGTPLSFALSDDTTLTRTKATHVKTIHYGLRRIYREAARWWHRQNDNKPVMPEDDARPFPIPLGICRGTPREFDCVLVADFAVSGEKLDYTLSAIASRVTGGQRICLFHWPDYNGWHGATIADEVFALCQQHGIGFAHVGLAITAPLVVMLDEALWAHPPSQVVQVDGLEQVHNRDGSTFEQQGALKVYFSNGGDDVPAFDQVV
ncbi:glycosyltransferase family 2 protein [Microbulbifer hydrolyticus]|uniref:Glycosyltransferase n=1 Tax=Microbulbifer hydrolyticus TaxID=48074 RepID=A0A6P1TDQ5_9GAMM|nr:glycosyltransferase family A protein [Microbulbifer hydrolyticus]MBB5212304.1 glycosyltransferase involved in cell wall biosynthesis [Microbulbifer hydrolyticus]QHQ39951.1 glycosyltransferase [Microbulbifer hydrolyticus]